MVLGMVTAAFIYDSFRSTVFSPMNGHSKRRTPLISEQFFFHRPNSGQSLIKYFLKGGQLLSGHSN